MQSSHTRWWGCLIVVTRADVSTGRPLDDHRSWASSLRVVQRLVNPTGGLPWSAKKTSRFRRLTGAQIATLEARGRRRAVQAGDVLFAEGDRGFSFYVVISGAVEILESSRGRPHTVVVHQPQQFTGDVDMLTGRAALVTARVAEDGEVLELSPSALREAVDEEPELGEVIVKAFLMRRSLLLSDGFEGGQDHRLALLRRRAHACATSRPATRSRSRGSISRATRRPRSSCASSAFRRRTRPS